MDAKIREAQLNILKIFSKTPGSFALAGGTALELYYLHHRFSVDLDFFSFDWNVQEIEKIVSGFKKYTKQMTLESEFNRSRMARVRFYSAPVEGSDRELKIDFVEDNILEKPKIVGVKGVPVYSAQNIYQQKLIAITGARFTEDDAGRPLTQGRGEVRDVFDIYMLSKKICPLHVFLKRQNRQIQRGMVSWYQEFSRRDLKLALLDLDIYDKKFDVREMIVYLEDEIRKFAKEELL